jgi:agmatinase
MTIQEQEFLGFDRAKAFLGTTPEHTIVKNAVNIFGLCFDGTTSFRPGSRLGPNAIRESSEGHETFSPYLRLTMDDYPVYDLGNLPFYPSRQDLLYAQCQAALKPYHLKNDRTFIMGLGGEHSISYPLIKKYLEDYPDLVILHLDAHTDLRDGYLDEKFSHASIIRRVLDHFDPHGKNQLIQYGIRSGLEEEFDLMQKMKSLCTSLDEFIARVKAIAADRPIYLTLDLDYFDPAYLPGTGTPEAGGETFSSFIRLMKVLLEKNLVGADVVELAPSIDPTGNSNSFAVLVTREILLALGKNCAKA